MWCSLCEVFGWLYSWRSTFLSLWFSDIFVSDPMSVAVVIFRGTGAVFRWSWQFFLDFDRATSVHFVIFAGCDNFFDSVRASTALAFRWGWAFTVFLPCFDIVPACLWGDFSGSEIPRFSGSGASHQRSLYWQPVHAPLLDSNWILTAQPSHRTWIVITLDCSTMD